MKIKKLQLRNIASIETADIDFENGLNEKYTGVPASIFLISGDTGVGKSVILDGISMALYKTTPRISGVYNKTKNNYTDAEGQTISVNSIEQYTRLGISENDDCYSELEFEGNDGKTYTARLELGIYRGNKDKQTGLRPMKYRTPVWTVETGGHVWQGNEVQQIIENAVGLSFDQFGRMAMLAQGQFANFLTGDRKEREAILEQLTNTAHFSTYGKAINELYKEAKQNKEKVEIELRTEKQHTLPEDEVTRLQKESEDFNKSIKEINEKQKVNNHRREQMGIILRCQENKREAEKKKHDIEKEQVSDLYVQKKTLVEDWNTSHQEREKLTILLSAKKDKENAEKELHRLKDTFTMLSADMEARQEASRQLSAQIEEQEKWLSDRKDRASLYNRAGEIGAKAGHYEESLNKTVKTEAQLKKEQSKTEGLKKVEEDAVKNAERSRLLLQDKQSEIDALMRQREELKPETVNKTLDDHKKKRETLEKIKDSLSLLDESIETVKLQKKEIEEMQRDLENLKTQKEKREKAYEDCCEEYRKVSRQLSTMKVSVEETFVNIRKKLSEGHADTCPLCGQHIEHIHIEDEFKNMLTPLEKAEKDADEKKGQAETERDKAREEYNKKDGALKVKKENLADLEKKNDTDRKQIEKEAREASLDIDMPLSPQIEESLGTLDKRIEELEQSRKQAEELQKTINGKTEERKPLEEQKNKAEKALTEAKGDVRSNIEALGILESQLKSMHEDLTTLRDELSGVLAPVFPDWQSDIAATREQLKKDADTYQKNQEKVVSDKNQLEKQHNDVKTIGSTRKQILGMFGDWDTQVSPKHHQSPNIIDEWTRLLTGVNTEATTINNSNKAIADSSAFLDDYYARTGKTETYLIELKGQETTVAEANKYVNGINESLKSRNDAISESQEQIRKAMKELGAEREEELPQKDALDNEADELEKQEDEQRKQLAFITEKLGTNAENNKKLEKIKEKHDAAEKNYNKWAMLNRYFGGDRFRNLVQTFIMRPLLKNANIYLEQITDRYRLTCSDDNEQLSIFVNDRYNRNKLRSATVLSGGERFMISLALSLALSSLNRPDMNVNILFIDEGFGTLDKNSLNSVMSTLEKLQEIAGQTNRRVGIISHREELLGRVDVKITVKKKDGRSHIEISN